MSEEDWVHLAYHKRFHIICSTCCPYMFFAVVSLFSLPSFWHRQCTYFPVLYYLCVFLCYTIYRLGISLCYILDIWWLRKTVAWGNNCSAGYDVVISFLQSLIDKVIVVLNNEFVQGGGVSRACLLPMSSVGPFGCLPSSFFNTENRPFVLLSSQTVCPCVCCIGPVSYTHLDVYKRQLLITVFWILLN